MVRALGVCHLTFLLLFIGQSKGQIGAESRRQASEYGEKTAIIVLHGLGVRATTACKWLVHPALGLSSSMNVVRCPSGPTKSTWIFPPTMIPGAGAFIASWFDFWMMPAMSVLSPKPGESKSDLEEALATIEGIIEELMYEGIPSENIVLSGASQGGVLTIYTALHSKYKLAGFIPIVTWVPLLKVEPPSSLPTPVNVNTHILHLNGLFDPIVSTIAGSRSAAAMKKVFPNYELKNSVGTHMLTMGSHNIPTVRRWLKKNTNINFSRRDSMIGNIPSFGGFGGFGGFGRKTQTST